MERKRKVLSNQNEYKNINNTIKLKMREAKEKVKKCAKIGVS